MKALAIVALLLVAFSTQGDTLDCKAPDVDAVQRVLNQQATAIMMLKQQYQQQQETIQDLRRRLWNTEQRQQA